MARNEQGKGVSLKDELFNKKKVQQLAAQFAAADPDFDAPLFVRTVMQTLLSCELKERIGCIADALALQLPKDFKKAAAIIVAALPPPLDPTKTDNDFGDFIYAPLGEYVARHGNTADHVQLALQTLREITQRFSMEDAIRTFLQSYPRETVEVLRSWVADEQYHVRRLVSEGTRPRLPWSTRLDLPTADTIALLDVLQADSTRYVTRSVANHLNDIAKDDPLLVVKTLQRWARLRQQDSAEMEWMTRHALRSLVKQGDPHALQLLGYNQQPQITVSDVVLPDATVAVGMALTFSFTVQAQQAEQLMCDYVIAFVRANGKRAEKVYKIKKMVVEKGGTVVIKKKHRFVAGATTRTFYPGVHRLTLQINGQRYGGGDFTLTV